MYIIKSTNIKLETFKLKLRLFSFSATCCAGMRKRWNPVGVLSSAHHTSVQWRCQGMIWTEIMCHYLDFENIKGNGDMWTNKPKVWLEDAGEAERPRWLEKPTVGYVQQV